MADQKVKIELNAVIVAVSGNDPQILVDPRQQALPSGPLATEHRTLEQGLRNWAGLPLGYVEQLYTFADKDRQTDGQRLVSIGYLALMQAGVSPDGNIWSSWYRFFPWEDHRAGAPAIIPERIEEVVANAAELARKNGLPEQSVEKLWRLLVAETIAYEEQHLGA